MSRSKRFISLGGLHPNGFILISWQQSNYKNTFLKIEKLNYNGSMAKGQLIFTFMQVTVQKMQKASENLPMNRLM